MAVNTQKSVPVAHYFTNQVNISARETGSAIRSRFLRVFPTEKVTNSLTAGRTDSCSDRKREYWYEVGSPPGGLLASAVSNSRVGEYVVELWNDLDPRYGDFGVRVPAITTEELWLKIVEFGVDNVHLLKLDCEGAEYTLLESLAKCKLLTQVGWIRGEWHGRRHRHRIADALSATHVFHVDPNPPHACGLVVGHRRQ